MPKKAKQRDLSGYTVHMVGNAHIDPVWQWRWEEGRQEVLDTCRAAVDRIKDTPGFIFCRSSAVTYRWIEETDPELFAEITRWIARERWCIVGGWWEQPDCNVPCGESLVRQGLYGQRYFLDKFGKTARTGYNVDTFGHAGAIPQILRKQGMEHYCFFRPDPHEKDLPSSLFWWEAPDGSRVLAARMPGHYGTWSDEIEERIREAAAQTPKGLRETMNFYGVGNHGGGPTKANIASILKVDADPLGPKTRFSSPDIFFDAVRPKAGKFPVVSEELQYHSRGCYTAVAAIKQHNRLSENLLMDAEKVSMAAKALIGLDYPGADLEYGWKRVLFNQFHDIMAGTSIRPACDDAIEHYRETEVLALRAIRNATGRVAAHVDTSGEGRPIVVHNTLSWHRTEVVEAEVSWPNHDDLVHVVDDQDAQVPFQVLHTNISGRGTTIRVAFLARVPACGYRVYRMVQGPGEPQEVGFLAGPTFLESGLYRLEFDRDTGYLTRILDKRTGCDLLGAPANVPLVIDDPSDTWSHEIQSFRNEKGRFVAIGAPELVEVGPVRARLRITMEHEGSALVQEITLYRQVPRIDVRMTVDYEGEHEFVKLAFPTALDEVTATYETPYAFAVRKADGNEEPAQKWADVSGTLPDGASAGLAVLNDSRYGYDIRNGELRLSVLRTPIYCFHDPAQVDARRRYEYTDQGVQSLQYALMPHAGDWRRGEVVRQAQQLNHPCFVREEPAHRGRLPRQFSLAAAEDGNVILEAIKQAEDSEAMVVRAYETSGEASEVAIALHGLEPATLCFAPCEIKTLLVADGKVVETDMLERQ